MVLWIPYHVCRGPVNGNNLITVNTIKFQTTFWNVKKKGGLTIRQRNILRWKDANGRKSMPPKVSIEIYPFMNFFLCTDKENNG